MQMKGLVSGKPGNVYNTYVFVLIKRLVNEKKNLTIPLQEENTICMSISYINK